MLATTPDESIGRVFDKVSRLLALPWSAKGPGASLEEFVAASPVEDNLAPTMPRTMPGILGFSFTGLHSVVERFVTARGGAAALDTATKRAVAGGFQTAAINQLEEKVALGLKWCRDQGCRDQGYGVKHLVVSGGVASNSYLRNRYVKFQGKSYLDADCSRLGVFLLNTCSQDSISLIFPPPELCTGKLRLSNPPVWLVEKGAADNAVMIAWASMHRFVAGNTDDYEILIRPKWRIEELMGDKIDETPSCEY